MVKPVNGYVLVEVVERDAYIQRKSGLMVPSAMTESQNGPALVVADIAEDANLTFDLKIGDRVYITDGRLLFFMGEDDKKYALLKQDHIAGVEYADSIPESN